MMRIALLLISASVTIAWSLPPPHPAVVAVGREEQLLPPHLRKPALHNPHLREVLPLTSLLHKGENLVYQRDADNVTRQEIYNILTHAGFLPRKPGLYRPVKHHGKRPTAQRQNAIILDELFDPPPFFHNPELLQYL